MKHSHRWSGLTALVVDAVTHGSMAVERIQKETAARPFALLEAIPPIAPVAKGVHRVHDVSVTGVHQIIRLVARTAGGATQLAFDALDRSDDAPASQYPGGRPPPGPPPPP